MYIRCLCLVANVALATLCDGSTVEFQNQGDGWEVSDRETRRVSVEGDGEVAVGCDRRGLAAGVNRSRPKVKGGKGNELPYLSCRM
jgi:hypothetical protein